MESWRHAWRVGFAPQMSREELGVLFTALDLNDPRFCHSANCLVDAWPPHLTSRVVACDPVTFGIWLISCQPHRAAVEDIFAVRCSECDWLLGEPGGCRYFLNWWDGTPHDEARKLLRAEIWEQCFGQEQPWHERTNR